MNLIYPMFAMVLITAAVMLAMFRSHVVAVRKGLPINYFKTKESAPPSADMVKTANHFTNLFEAPVLFYAGCLAAMVVGAQGGVYVFFAWFFVVARVVHAAIHLGPNKVIPRMTAYMSGWIALLGLWFTLMIDIATRG